MATTNKNSKLKPVHFNLDNPSDLELYNKACRIDNFTKWVKEKLREECNLGKEATVGREDIKEIIKEVLSNEYLMMERGNILPQEKVEEKTIPLRQEDMVELDSMIL